MFEAARFAGTAVRLIDPTSGHLAHGAEDSARALMDARADAHREGHATVKSDDAVVPHQVMPAVAERFLLTARR